MVYWGSMVGRSVNNRGSVVCRSVNNRGMIGRGSVVSRSVNNRGMISRGSMHNRGMVSRGSMNNRGMVGWGSMNHRCDSIIMSFTFISDLSNVSRVSLGVVGDNLGPAIGKSNTVRSRGGVSITGLILTKGSTAVFISYSIGVGVNRVLSEISSSIGGRGAISGGSRGTGGHGGKGNDDASLGLEEFLTKYSFYIYVL